MERRVLRPPGSHPSLVLLEPCFPAYCACRPLWASIATLAQSASCFARQPEGENGAVYSTLPEPDPRQLSRGVDLRAAHIRQATGWASLDGSYGAITRVSFHQRGEPGSCPSGLSVKTHGPGRASTQRI
jgi:hypothetical protein